MSGERLAVRDAQEAILANARSLLETVTILEKAGRHGHAAHFAALCVEECSKCLMLFESVEKVFAAGAKKHHQPKGKLVGVFHYLAGKLSAIYQVQHVGNQLLAGLKGWKTISEAVMMKSGATGPEALGEVVEEYLTTLNEHPRMDASDIMGHVRKATVYCDVESGNVLSPDTVTEKDMHAVMSSARLAVGLLDMAMNKRFNWKEFMEIFPDQFGDLAAEADKWVEDIKKSIEDEERAAKAAQPEAS